MEHLIANAALYSTQITHLFINGLDHFSFLAPFLAPFAKLRSLLVHFHYFVGADASGWPQPRFQLESLTFGYWFIDEGSAEPPLAEFQWLTSSSRESLRHLDIVGYSHAIVADILQWGHNLHTLRIGIFYWINRDQMLQTLELARLRSLHALTISVGPAQMDGGHPETDEFNDFVAELYEAVDGINDELGMEVVVIDVDEN